MAFALLHLVLAAAACFGLWRLWCRQAGRGPASLIIGAGFIVRAFLAQALFWISWLGLPIGRSLQIGNGFWFFAIDGPGQLANANELLHGGALAVVFPDHTYPSHFYIQVFASFVTAFGGVASIGILLNCAAYILTCALIVRMTMRDGRVSAVGLVALGAIAFGPAAILWSLQPLKDTLFFLLIVAMVAVCWRWQGLWRGDVGAKARWQLSACVLAILALTYAIGGIRWYVAAIVWGAFGVFCILTTLTAHRKGWAVVANVLLFLLLAQAVRLGGGTDIPASVGRALNPKTVTKWRPSGVIAQIARIRRGFETTPGATRIVTARPVAATAAPAPPAKSPPPVPAQAVPVQAVVAPALPKPSTLEPPSEAFADRFISGVAATFLPRRVAQAFGLLRVGGGRGFWLFTEFDTVVFDLVLLFAVVYCAGALIRSRAHVTPLFIMLSLVFVMLAVPMIYTVTNFGTLFRLRQMLYVIAAILPITLDSERS